MSQISKCPKVKVILSYWEALGEVSKLRYKSLLYFSSNGSYCRSFSHIHTSVNIFWGKEFYCEHQKEALPHPIKGFSELEVSLK